MELLIVGLGSMGKRRARLLKGIDRNIALYGVDTSPSRRQEAAALGVEGFESIDAALAAKRFDGALVCTSPTRPSSASCSQRACRCSPS